MPKKKPSTPKKGRKDSKTKTVLDMKLRELYDEDGITPWLASQITHCGYKYAALKFKAFGITLVENEDEDWIERNDRVRKRALEGLALNIKKSNDVVKRLQDQLSDAKKVMDEIMPRGVANLEDTKLGEVIDSMSQTVMMKVYNIIDNTLNMHKNYGYYVGSIEQNIKGQELFKVELQQQYDTIEILPPPSQILSAELEKRIAARNALAEARTPGGSQEAPRINSPQITQSKGRMKK